jgi:hypothetical protein
MKYIVEKRNGLLKLVFDAEDSKDKKKLTDLKKDLETAGMFPFGSLSIDCKVIQMCVAVQKVAQ